LASQKNRMQKFYNPKLYKAPPAEAPVFVQVRSHVQHKADPGPAPEANFGGSKTEESGGVIAMMDGLVMEIDKEMTEAETNEKDGQGDYEQMMSDSAEKRADDSKSLADREAAKANGEADLQQHTDDNAATSKTLGATMQVISSLHGECDWLIQYYVARKEARDSEIDAMGHAKAILKGADFEELLQTELQTKVKPLLSRK